MRRLVFTVEICDVEHDMCSESMVLFIEFFIWVVVHVFMFASRVGTELAPSIEGCVDVRGGCIAASIRITSHAFCFRKPFSSIMTYIKTIII